jgi:peptide subunit release factor 1 (eRF1)
MPASDQLQEQLDRLASFGPTGAPVVSVYLDARSDQRGRDSFDAFLRREFRDRARGYPAGSAERESLDRDFGRIGAYLRDQLQPSTNAVAVFASSASDGFFEAAQFAAPLQEHWVYVADRPQLYPLARLGAQYPRYAAVLVDTSAARIFVFAVNQLVREREVKGTKTRGRSGMGGWSQPRYQRRVDNAHRQLVKEVVEVLDRVVRADDIPSIILAGDEVALPLIKGELPNHLAQKVIDDIHLPSFAAAHEVLSATVDVVARHNVESDKERVAEVLAAYRGRGLGVVGPQATLSALEKGQVEELLISAAVQAIRPVEGQGAAGAAISRGGAALSADASARTADELVTRARQTGARTTFIEDASLLQEFGGVAAALRFVI